MRAIALALLLLGLLLCVATQADKDALVAGTAKGSLSVASKQYFKAVHYPHGVKDPQGYYLMDGSHPKPFNGTFAYGEWPDKALVPGRVAAMTPDYCIFGSRQRSTAPRAAST